jgi:transcriptional regulator with XRE-family HTH domain
MNGKPSELAATIARIMPRPTIKQAPPFGQRLAALRRKKGLSQRELAELLKVTPKMVDYYERRAVNPAIAVVEKAALVLEVSPAELLGESAPRQKKREAGPVGRMRKLFEQASKLPRSQQEKIAAVLEAFINQHSERGT